MRLPIILIAAMCPLAHADSLGNFSFTGTFTSDTDLQFFTFTLLSPTSGVALRTWSYSGGTNAASQVIPSGGFEPYLNLYLSDGTGMNPGASGPCTVPLTGNPVANLLPDPATGGCGDVYYPTTKSFPGGVWAAGTYTLALSTFANPGVGNLSDGFFAESVLGLTPPSNFTCESGSPGFQGNPPTVPVDQPFCDEFSPGMQRTGNWALDILNVDSATELTGTPEPATFTLCVLGILFFCAKQGRKLWKERS
jgi:hypothetical protein